MAERGEPPVARSLRPDIQGLRALAVSVVIIYHFRPDLLPGGFVGVDVFLVISGFLIVGSLVRESAQHGRIDVVGFYARRIRRLLPAATATLLAIVAATVVLLPASRWQPIAMDVVMSALHVQNWNQAFSSTGYEAATALVSPVQHYWSLAVEEQFYVVIPLVLILAGTLARRLRVGTRRTMVWVLVLVTGASLVHSVLFSATNHQVAYFATSTRAWELGLGGLTALLMPRLRLIPAVSAAAGWVGLAMVLAASLLFTAQMDFPGFVALLPVVGSALILLSGSGLEPRSITAGGSLSSLGSYLSVRPITYLGDISYSLYLWHWPLVVFFVFLKGGQPGGKDVLVMAGLSLVLAVMSYHLIEQFFRHGKAITQPGGRRFRPRVQRRRAFALGSALVIASCVTAMAPWSVVEVKAASLAAALSSENYPGALAFEPRHPARVPEGQQILPHPAAAIKDVSRTYKDGCNVYNPAKTPDDKCLYGDLSASRTLVVIGDSHAGQYVDPLAEVGFREGWKVQAMVRNGCPFTAAAPASADTVYENCANQNRLSLVKLLDQNPERVIVSGMSPEGYEQALEWGWSSREQLVSGYEEMLKPLKDDGIEVTVLVDTPYPTLVVPDCMQRAGQTASKCSFRDPAANRDDPLRTAADRIGGIQVVDLHGYFCRSGNCPAVIGNVLVYRDNHLTNTFARTLAGPLQRALGL